MAGGFDDDKTEAPTPRRREKAREEGQVVHSPDLTSACVLFVASLLAMWMGPALGNQLQSELRTRIETLDGSTWTVASTVISARWLFTQTWMAAGSLIIGVSVLGILISQIQSGFLITARPIELKWERLSPVEGFQRLFSWDSTVRGLLALLKITALLAVAIVLVQLWLPDLKSGTRGHLGTSLALGWRCISQVMVALSGTALVWGVTDFAFKYFRNEQKLKMTKQEIRDEYKEDQGDPQVRARIRRMQKDAMNRKMLTAVPEASVVLTNPTHFAVALKYEAGKSKAPKIIAKGSDAFARRIAQVARENGVPVLERKPLARALFALGEVGREIPIELYRAVAEILAYVYRLKNSK